MEYDTLGHLSKELVGLFRIPGLEHPKRDAGYLLEGFLISHGRFTSYTLLPFRNSSIAVLQIRDSSLGLWIYGI